jgi:hypothetical protein
MKHSLLTLLVLILLISNSGFSQDPNNPRWNQDARSVVNLSGDYVPLPVQVEDSPAIPFTTEPREFNTPNGVLVAYPNVRVQPGNNFSQSECPIVSSPLNRNILFASSNAYTFSTGNINSGVYVSTDGGVTWTGKENLGAGSLNNQRGDPGPTISKFGTFLFTHLTSNTNFGSLTGMGANRSTDNGLTWTNTFQVVNDANADKNMTSTDDSPSSPYYGQSYFAWTSFSDNNGRTSRTTNDGVSWTSQLTLNSSPANHFAQGHDVATGPNGEVYICWTAGTFTGNFTEDYVGLAKSVNGGVSYTANENIFDDNGSRSNSFNGWGIRTNGFPRIAVDKTGGVRNGWIYIVVSQFNLAPAGSDADVVLHRSSDGGATWSAGFRVNQDGLNNGKVQFFPAVCVDEYGGVDVVYYDNRNFPSVGDSCSVYISRSIDGGSTWSDVEIADHHFKPKQMSPFGGGYMGDYIGITQSVGKVVAVWSDDKISTPTVNRPNVWAGALDVTPSLPSTYCQDFSGATFPTSDMTLEFTGTQYWSRQTPSAYASGTGSAKFDFWNAAAGVSQSMVTNTFVATAAGTSLVFDRSYSPWFTSTDSLIIETSVNGGTTYTNLARMWGNENGGAPLNTVPRINDFLPSSGGDWRPNVFAIPTGTNKIRFKAVSGFGNNLYLDNICLQTLATPVSSSIGLIIEGLYIPNNPYNFYPDTVTVYLQRTDFPNVKVDSARDVLGSNAVVGNLLFGKALNGTYYRVVKHRNSIETWSNIGVAYNRGSNSHHNFVPNGESYGNNMANVGPFKGMYSGDINQDGTIDASDLSLSENSVSNSLSGYVVEDVTGDFYCDGSDLSIVENNQGVNVIAPPGAEPTPSPEITDQRNIYKSDSERLKIESGLKIQQLEKNAQDLKNQQEEELNSNYNKNHKNRIIDRSVNNSNSGNSNVGNK